MKSISIVNNFISRSRDWWKQNKRFHNPWESLAIIIIFLYPLRHIHVGIDYWDVGYNYSNFMYAGLDTMDSMWFFSTFLANIVGHILTFLPAGKTLLGLNLYTGLFLSFLGCIAYWICTRQFKVNKYIVTAGVVLAEAISWCPTALLYNYLTYILFVTAIAFMYNGLIKRNMRALFTAGIILGINLFVRFSNLAETGMILAVWIFGVLEHWDYIRKGNEGVSGAMSRTLYRTFACVCGYLLSVLSIFLILGIRYGFTAYVNGIVRLFGMTEAAPDYKASGMLSGIFRTYLNTVYWPVRLSVFCLAGMLVVGIAKALDSLLERDARYRAGQLRFAYAGYILSAILALGGLVWMLKRGFCSTIYTSYDSIFRPAVVLMMLMYVVLAICVVRPNTTLDRKLAAGLVMLSSFIACLGSNNGVASGWNFLYLGLPLLLDELVCFAKMHEPNVVITGKLLPRMMSYISPVPAKLVVGLFSLLVGVQLMLFGHYFTFAEGSGIRNAWASVYNNTSLEKMRMAPERADAMSGLSRYFEGRDDIPSVVLYGNIPAITFYLQLNPAFNSWPDLASYSSKMLKMNLDEIANNYLDAESEYMSLNEALDKTKEEYYYYQRVDKLLKAGMAQNIPEDMLAKKLQDSKNKYEELQLLSAESEEIMRSLRPVLILENEYALFTEGNRKYAVLCGVEEGKADIIEADIKFEYILEFMEEMNYEQSYRNGKFAVYE